MSFHPETENYKYWTKEEDKKIKDLVALATPLKEIALIMKRGYTSCASRCSLLKVYNRYCGPRKYTVNENFWDEPNFLNCYYAGVLAADGCLMLNNKRFENVGTLTWELHDSDISMLEEFKKATNFTGPIYRSIRKGGYNHAKIRINCERWNKQLIEKFNIVPKKTFRLKPPNDISDQLFFCWLIGEIDGDGTVHVDQNGKLVIKITSCSEFLIKYIHKFLEQRFVQTIRNKTVSKPRKLKDTNCWEVSICGVRAVCLFAYLRQYNLPKLVRKWEQPLAIELENSSKKQFPHFFDFSHLPPPVLASDLLVTQQVTNNPPISSPLTLIPV